ncbi:acyl-CoA thioesterase [Arhodomonas sp. SL1]|uniref:acyl-CoA thioesterase n=1 Tax=Arhodomonas sp. SL1 TaxID=3425691 RepID=UPI003F88380C
MKELSRTVPVTGIWCDATGTLHTWRYLEVVNGLVEAWFAQVGYSFRAMHISGDVGTPTTRLHLDVATPAALGETLQARLRLLHLGHSSLGFHVTACCDGAPRMDARVTLVWVANDRGRLTSRPIPEDLRGRMAEWLADVEAGLENTGEGAPR